MCVYNITNISGGLLVYDLLKGNTLRLNNRQCKTLKETEVDNKILEHFNILSSKGIILFEKVQEHKEKKEVKKENPKVNENVSKEEK